MSAPLISICIPAYKNVEYLQRLLQSISVQVFMDFEIVITDNSPDNSVELLANKYSQLPIRYYRNEPPTNMGENFNLILQKAIGKWIKMMHDDDWFTDKNSLQIFADATRSNTDFIFSACDNVNLQNGKIEKHEFDERRRDLLQSSVYNLFYENVIGHPSAVMHKNVNIFYDPSFKWVIDIDFYIRFLQKYPNWHYISEPCINIGIDTGQFSNQYYKNPLVEIPEYFNLLKKFSFDLLENKNVFHAFWLLVRKFKIKNFDEIKKAGYDGFIPPVISKIINYQKKIPRIIIKQTPWSKWLMKRCFKKIHQGLYK